tara:strand:+ start:152 stop:394 length:243 start_codon:yes stop_codon:yes gene_type:complete
MKNLNKMAHISIELLKREWKDYRKLKDFLMEKTSENFGMYMHNKYKMSEDLKLMNDKDAYKSIESMYLHTNDSYKDFKRK